MVALEPDRSASGKAKVDSTKGASLIRTITADQIDFSETRSTPVISSTLRFIVPVPERPDGGEPLLQQEGEGAGQPFMNRRGLPVKGKGFAFYNPDDKCNDFVRCDGKAVIIIGNMKRQPAELLDARIRSMTTDPQDMSLDQLRCLLKYAREELGLLAFNSSTRAFVRESLEPAAHEAQGEYGLYRRRSDQLCRAVFIPGSGQFLGPAATPQLFSDGAVILLHAGAPRLIQRRSFEENYRHPDGRALSVEEIARQWVSPRT